MLVVWDGMKILWVKAGRLLPVDTGGKIRSFNIIRHLAKQHELRLLTFYGGPRDLKYEQAMAEWLPAAQTIHTGKPEGGFRQSLDYLLRLPSSAPYAVRKFTHPLVQRAVSEKLDEGSSDVAVCDFLSASLNFPERTATPVVLFQHNVETMLWRRMAGAQTSFLRKISYTIEAGKMARYEAARLRRFRHVIAVSENDRKEMLALAPDCPITVVPTGVDTEKYRAVPSARGEPPLIVFTGSMDWEPNVDAVEYFCREIWRDVLADFPKARFQIVGRNPHARVRQLASDSVEVTGSVASVADYLREASVVVVPLRIGGGTRLKIFEAMAMAKAMVSTSIGAEGLDVLNGRDLLIADDAKAFGSAILRLLRDPETRRSYEEAAAACAAQYDWSHIATRFAEVLQEAVCGSGSRRGIPEVAASPVRS